MRDTAQEKAAKVDRKRLAEPGMARFEVLGLKTDAELIRVLARRLAEDGPGAEAIRLILRKAVSQCPPKKGGILAALRRSPLVGVDLKTTRS